MPRVREGVDLARVDGTGKSPGTQPVYVVSYDGDRLILGQDALFELGERIHNEKCVAVVQAAQRED